MKMLVILKTCSKTAIRLAGAGLKKHSIKMFCYGDGVAVTKNGQEPMRNFVNTGREIEGLINNGLDVVVCGSCARARGIKENELVLGARIGKTGKDLPELISWADRVIMVK
ncbi:MAG: DsrE family protein [Thermoplasmatales archaeon]|nr:DsrE family protein [Thermoplasmatales archaeon]